MVTGSPAMIQALEAKGYDVGYVGELNEAGVYVDAACEARLRAEGYAIGQTVEDESTRLARKAQTRRSPSARRSRPRSRRTASRSPPRPRARSRPGNVVIQRAYTFTNYAGRFLYVEAHNKLHGDTTGPTMSSPTRAPNGTSQVHNLSTARSRPTAPTPAIGGNKIGRDAGTGASTCTTAG